MYNPFDENNTTNNAKDNEPLEQDTAREEEPVNASQPESPASPEYHYTGSEVKDRAPSEQQTTYTASGYGQQPGSYSGQGQQRWQCTAGPVSKCTGVTLIGIS